MNDGRSLAMIGDASVDFAFSFDSLVHADAEVVASYIRELARTLGPDGVGFVHHSKAGRYRHYFELADAIPRGRVRERLYELHILDRPRWRALDMTAERFRQSCKSAGLQPGDRQLDHAAAHRLHLDLHAPVVSPGASEPCPGEPRFRRRGKVRQAPSAAVFAVESAQ